MSEIDRNEIKKTIEEVLHKTEEYGKQAEQYASTNKELKELISEQLQLKDKFVEIVNSHKSFIEYIDESYNDKIIKKCESTFEQIKDESGAALIKFEKLESDFNEKMNLVVEMHKSFEENVSAENEKILEAIKVATMQLDKKNEDLMRFNKELEMKVNLVNDGLQKQQQSISKIFKISTIFLVINLVIIIVTLISILAK